MTIDATQYVTNDPYAAKCAEAESTLESEMRHAEDQHSNAKPGIRLMAVEIRRLRAQLRITEDQLYKEQNRNRSTIAAADYSKQLEQMRAAQAAQAAQQLLGKYGQ